MERLIITDWSISNPCKYLCYAILISLFVRVVASALRALDFVEHGDPFASRFKNAFSGFNEDPLLGDRWIPSFLGLIELLVYPFLMVSGLWVGVAGWITLKTVAQWNDWSSRRSVFNRFLIGNILIVVLAFVYCSPMVYVEIKQDKQMPNSPAYTNPLPTE